MRSRNRSAQPTLTRFRVWFRTSSPRARFLWGAALLIGLVLLDAIFLPSGQEFATGQPLTTALIEARRREATDEKTSLQVRQTWIPLKHVDSDLIRAILVAEDSAFADHGGFDLAELWSALWQSIRHLKRLRGASTISQQLAKNLYLDPARSYFRKWREAVITIKMERALSKRRILELYLNVIEWGNGIFGIEAAARHYLGKSASSLTREDAAFLAAIVPNPRTAYNPHINPRRVAARQRIILRRMERYQIPSLLR